jgi:hypothetical protein
MIKGYVKESRAGMLLFANIRSVSAACPNMDTVRTGPIILVVMRSRRRVRKAGDMAVNNPPAKEPIAKARRVWAKGISMNFMGTRSSPVDAGLRGGVG